MLTPAALSSDAELTRHQSRPSDSIEGRRWPRESRHGNLTLFPQVELAELVEGDWAPAHPPKLSASISDVSRGGVGLILSEQLPGGLEFDVIWEQGDSVTPLRFEVMHSRPTAAGQYRTGARLVMGFFPEDTADHNGSAEIFDEEGLLSTVPAASSAFHTIRGVLQYLSRQNPDQEDSSTPPGTFRACQARGFDKTEMIRGETASGSEQCLSIRRSGERLWVHVHLPGNQDGGGVFVDAGEFESACSRLRQSSVSPFASSLAA